MKGKTNPWVVIGVIAILYFAWSSGAFKNVGGTGAFSTSPLVNQNQPVTTQAFTCQTGGTNSLRVAVRDGLVTTSTLYTPVSVAAVDSTGKIVLSATSNPGTTLSYATASVPCGNNGFALKGRAVILAGNAATTNYAEVPYDASVLTGDALIVTSNTTQMQWVIRQVGTGTNMSGPGNPDVQSANETAPVTMASGDTRSRVVEFSGVTGNRQFGSSLGVIWAIDTADSTVFSDLSMSFTSSQVALQPITCPPREVAQDSANRCYKSGPIKTSDGILSGVFTQSADLGNPGATADPRLYVNDIQCFEEDGQVVCDTFDKASNNVAVGRQQVGFDNS